MTRAHPASQAGGLDQHLPVLEQRRFLFVTGKGGVGKTTVAGALALAFAARGKRVLVAMCNTKERLSAILGSEPIGDEPEKAKQRIAFDNLSPRYPQERIRLDIFLKDNLP